MKFLISLLCLIGYASHGQAAEISNSAWVGDSELYLDGKLHCSGDPSKKPTYRPVGMGYHSLVIHEGGLGWIWPSITGGCAHSLGNGLQLQQNGNELFDSNARKVGSITNDRILAQGYVTSPDGVTIEKLDFLMLSPEEAKVEVKFRSPHYRGLFTYMAKYKRYRDSNWP